MGPELLVPAAGGGTYCAVRIIVPMRPPAAPALRPPAAPALRPAVAPAMRPVAVTPDARVISDAALVARFTRNWIHYGFLGHTVLCVLIAAVEGLMGR